MARRGRRMSGRMLERPFDPCSAASIASPSASSLPRSKAGKSRGSSSGPVFASGPVKSRSCFRSRGAFSRTAAAATRIEIGCAGSRPLRSRSNRPWSTLVRPPARAASASIRTSSGDALSRATRSSAACRSAAASLDGGAARATEIALRVTSSSRPSSARTSGAIQGEGNSFARVLAIALSATRRSLPSAMAARRSWIAGFSANWTSFCCNSSRAASVRFVAARRSWKNPASALPHSGRWPAIHQAVSFRTGSDESSSGMTASAFNPPPSI